MLLIVSAILLQSLACFIVYLSNKKAGILSLGFTFLLIGALYHGFTELLQLAFPGVDAYRDLVNQSDVNIYMLLISGAMLLFALGYAVVMRIRRKQQPTRFPRDAHWWGWIVVAGIGYVISLSGQGEEFLGYWLFSLTSYLTIFAIILASVAVIFRWGPGVVIPVVIVQTMLTALLGSRLTVFASGIALLAAIRRAGIRVPWTRVVPLIGLLVVLMVSISAARSRLGRENIGEGLTARAEWLGSGVVLSNSEGITDAIVRDFVYRFDGNAFGGIIHDALSSGAQAAGWGILRIDALLVVPRVFFSGKFDGDTLNEEAYIVTSMGLPDTDYTPGVFGVLYGSGGAWALLLASLLLGMILARVDSWLNIRGDLFAVLIGIACAYSAVFFEQGFTVWLISLRGCLILYAGVVALQWISHLKLRID